MWVCSMYSSSFDVFEARSSSFKLTISRNKNEHHEKEMKNVPSQINHDDISEKKDNTTEM